ncbi:GDSL esterase/lipase [Ananas comosus]|uniref:GDSL esterase/lipase n=1 Tax=Ananas comosus TaxID=4615 RepID=A0A199VGZ0_ANACO|nr:GDSL esterase/lipase [Ananas comosus]
MATGALSPLLLSLCLIGLALQRVDAAINAMFVFGDSTVDVGNNNYLNDTKAKANFPHYGIDFPGSVATGRFSNGYNTADLLAQQLGFPMSPPPFLSLSTPKCLTEQMFKGINFASGGSGILDQTGPLQVGEVIPMNTQVQNFATVRRQMDKLAGPAGAADFLSRSLFFISAGSNDMFEYSSKSHGNDTAFIANLTSTYGKHLKALYNFGARKFGIVSIPPLGCCPSQRLRNQTGGCYEMLNSLSRGFYPAIGATLQGLQSELPEMSYALGNGYEMVAYIFEDPQPLHFKELKIACCGSGKYNGSTPCAPTLPFCANRTDHLFWDWFHPTEAVSEMAAETLYSGNRKFVTPINFKELALL